MINNDNLNLTAFEAVELLRQKKLKVATAESCTSGMLSSLITSVSGSSEIFELGISAYSSRIKEEALSVPAEVLKTHGAISKETAMYLAKNVRSLSESNLGIGITGNAGPTADENKPVGLVFVGIADKNGYFVKELNLSPLYSREEIRSIASLEALSLIKAYAESYPDSPSFFLPFYEQKLKKEITTEAPPTPRNTFLPLEGEELEAALLDKNDVFTSPKETLTKENDTAINLDDTVLLTNTFENFDVKEPEQEEVPLETEEKENKIKIFLSGLWDKIKINKENGLKDNITKVIFLISLLTFLASAIVLGWHFISDFKQQSIINSAQDLYNDLISNENDTSKLFETLVKENPDIKAWLTIKNANVDHPICQTTDNDFYLHHNMYKTKSRYGTLFFDCRNAFGADGRSQNLTVYGHNMNDGSMFGKLKKYQNLDFYKENPTFTLTTAESIETYAIFSVMIMNAVSKDDNGYLYGFTRSSFANQEDFLSWIAEARERSLITTDIQIDGDAQILTLVSCADEKTSFRNARLVIMAKRLYIYEEAIFTVNASHNPNPRYPQAWYDAKGLKGYTPTSSSTTSSNNTTSEDVQSEASSDVSSSDVSTSRVQSTTTSNTASSSVSSKAPTVSSKPTTSVSSNQATTSSSSVPEVSSQTQTSSEPEDPPSATSDTTTETEPKEGS